MVSNSGPLQDNEGARRPRGVSLGSAENSKTSQEIFGDFQKDFSTCSSEDEQKTTDKLYSKYAETYESGMQAINYKDPEILAKFVAESHLVDPESDFVCDFGSGTGLLGVELHKLGFKKMLALDGNEPMLAKAKALGIYQETIHLWVGLNNGSFPTSLCNRFDAVVSTGCFMQNHFPKEALDDILLALKSGGKLFIAARANEFEIGNGTMDYAEKVQELKNAGKIRLIKKQEYTKNPGPQVVDENLKYFFEQPGALLIIEKI